MITSKPKSALLTPLQKALTQERSQHTDGVSSACSRRSPYTVRPRSLRPSAGGFIIALDPTEQALLLGNIRPHAAKISCWREADSVVSSTHFERLMGTTRLRTGHAGRVGSGWGGLPSIFRAQRRISRYETDLEHYRHLRERHIAGLVRATILTHHTQITTAYQAAVPESSRRSVGDCVRANRGNAASYWVVRQSLRPELILTFT